MGKNKIYTEKYSALRKKTVISKKNKGKKKIIINPIFVVSDYQQCDCVGFTKGGMVAVGTPIAQSGIVAVSKILK